MSNNLEKKEIKIDNIKQEEPKVSEPADMGTRRDVRIALMVTVLMGSGFLVGVFYKITNYVYSSYAINTDRVDYTIKIVIAAWFGGLLTAMFFSVKYVLTDMKRYIVSADLDEADRKSDELYERCISGIKTAFIVLAGLVYVSLLVISAASNIIPVTAIFVLLGVSYVFKVIEFLVKRIKHKEIIVKHKGFWKSILVLIYCSAAVFVLAVFVQIEEKGNVAISFHNSGKVAVEQEANYQSDISLDVYPLRNTHDDEVLREKKGEELTYARSQVLNRNTSITDSVNYQTIRYYSTYEIDLLDIKDEWYVDDNEFEEYEVEIVIKIRNKKVMFRNIFTYEGDKLKFVKKNLKQEI